jgi:hypothetical protein
MKIEDHDIAAIKALGYTEAEARFLYIVATHSGYFVPRQFLDLTGASWGYRTDQLSRKLESRGHATWREYQDTGGVYHLFSKKLTVQAHADRTYHERDFKLRTDPVDSGPGRWNPSRERTAPSGPRELSQSERDWAYAKRALARGLPPEEVMRDIAEFRAHEKYDPDDYARRTVTKAEAELNAQASSRKNEGNREPSH